MSTASMERYLNPCFSFNDPLGIPGRCSWTQSQRRATGAAVSSSHAVPVKISPVAVSTSEALRGTIVGCSVLAGIHLLLERGDVRPLDDLVAVEILLGAAEVLGQGAHVLDGHLPLSQRVLREDGGVHPTRRGDAVLGLV